MSGIAAVVDSIFPSTESLELLIEKLIEQDKFERILMGVEHPCIYINEDGKSTPFFLDDTPRLRQMY